MKKQKGQDLIEYALMLALVVGIGGFIYTRGYGANISGVFNNAGNLLEQVDKSQEEAKEEAARNADRSYADYMAKLLKDAVQNGVLTMNDGTTVYLLAQNKPGTKLDNSYVNGAVYGQAKVNEKDYGNQSNIVGFDGLWKAVDSEKSYANASVHQKYIDWYGVGITRHGDSYSLSYVEGKRYNPNNGFDPRKGTEYKNETWKNPKDALIHS